ncbi:tail fiber domain-containing protein [Agrobacterium tumefaciens]|uniref:tail fiber domain-containing protein n=1 Tax=Agrobacterium tumefaciens TaxID=358 RepID=UPI0021D32F08|nr:tail fiber domain-containing protein [Agrobacterium tumefaciens]UXS01096.1 tail fiber domain-containing protein [Agrobacterium tumefaciens]
MGKGSSSAPGPDPQIGAAALKQAETGEAWLAFAQDAFAVSQDRQKELDALTTKVTEQQLGLATDQATWAKEDRERYNSVYKPIEDEFIEEATNYATEERQTEAAAEARADVQSAAATNRAATERANASMGVTPGSGRFTGVQAASDLGTTLAEAGAANTARQAVRDKGLALKADVANLGKGLPAQAAAGAAGSVAASGTALGGSQATNSQALAASTILNAGYGGAMQGYAGQAGTLNQQYGLQLDAWKTQQQMNAQNASGIGSFLGGIGGLIFSDEEVKENKEEIEDGDALDALNSMPVEEWDYKPGVADEGRHVGTYAQDFQRATGKGDGHTIPVQDAIGITMKAVQDLDKKLDATIDAIGLGGVAPAPRKTSVPSVKRKPAEENAP